MLIGLTGFAGAGKDTAAAHLRASHGFERRAFADKLKDLAYAQNPDVAGPGTPLRALVDREGWDAAKRDHAEVRRLLQDIGQSHRAVFGEDFWLNRVLPDSAGGRRYTGANHVVVTDLRYPNEADRVRALGGIVVRIERAGVGPVNDHESEQPLQADVVVNNIEGDPEHLLTALEYIIRIEKGELPLWRAF